MIARNVKSRFAIDIDNYHNEVEFIQGVTSPSLIGDSEI